MSDDICGYEGTTTGEPCRHPAGSCPVDSHSEPQTDGGSKRGRPTKFNDERAQAAIQAAENGVSEAGCGRAAGVSHTTIQRWREKNLTFTDADGEEREFSAAFRRARNQGESVLINDGLRDPDVDSAMARFLLASSFGYVKAERREHTGDGGGPVEITLSETVVETAYDE